MQPVSPEASDQVVEITPGSSFKEVAGMLEARGIIRSSNAFYLLAWYEKALRSIQAGEYRLSGAQTPGDILEILVQGKTIQHIVIIPEGYNMFQIASLMDRAGIVGRDDFLNAARDKKLLAEMGIPGDSAEGYLFPDTYNLTKGATASEIIRLLIKKFWSVWYQEGFDARAKAIGEDVNKVIILASIVEKEAMRPSERPLIAGVFWNRLKKRMPLQADPTVRYGILIRRRVSKRRLRWRDLREKTPYNTYVIKGLPKGPISNPGVDSIMAVLFPARTRYLYFVSKNNGTHKFSTNLREHNLAVEMYQKKHTRSRKRALHPSPPLGQGMHNGTIDSGMHPSEEICAPVSPDPLTPLSTTLEITGQDRQTPAKNAATDNSN